MTLITPPHRRASRGGGRCTLSLAECDCGWSHRAKWALPELREQDNAIEKHWRQVDQATPKAP